ncbi:hypothetical protein BC939DRAFT_322885 [Gamsiella multidivaricata]|uniref:uncharacterized protein n=1 Tax=Gamsiella multidivaricata TaxID=101098 RepID=UPI00221EC173|nr:uncharacterized protein BC939DRAFT_322885 [Gamsiella multidivaricata]KAI7829838.1 hypothetical protein BC939DRAFT_322885 [Gamsiella multidivaricata]
MNPPPSLKDMSHSGTASIAQPAVFIPGPDGMPISTPVPVFGTKDSTTTVSAIDLVASEKTLVGLPHKDDKPGDTTTSDANEKEHLESLTEPDGSSELGNVVSIEASAPMTFPDGGFGWAVVFGAFMIQFW